MMTMVKIVLLMLVVLKAAALENSREIDSNHELHPYPPQASRNVDEEGPHTADCVVLCIASSCEDKKYFKKILCIGACLAKCIIKPSDSPYEIACVADCAQSAANNIRYGANKMNDQVSSCKEQCKKD